ncbi:CRISPR-associated endoribonuclease Cas6 [Adhaeribacter pallidiroseus]|uniref:CRISPR-associated endoribonuclease n=1 Tax=Adhaeribacter pallidiroseus TaxID=2072847 RepID=A0A369QBJ4_9BACT|nr:CRISPR-associated endoribonuclease Cas6 [Adhaeribacter pallidiroseus]RDC62293.1 hypothetical protein AHMF7616_00886 [Adhaeribacter pallidiroseus]
MRFNLTLNLPDNNYKVLPLNYQYELSAWIYKVINLGDASFSFWLHSQGYLANGRHYKLFTFSRLNIPQFKIAQDRLQIISTTATLSLSFYMPASAETFISGLFKQQQFSLGDTQSQVKFEVAAIAAEPTPAFKPQTQFRLVSPLCASTQRDQQGKLMPLYLSPEDSGFKKIFAENLLNKYAAGAMLKAPPAVSPLLGDVQFHLLSKPISKLVTIKANTPQQTKVRGYLFDFELEASPELTEAGYFAGFGEKNSLGFGCAEFLK